jgi:hypothetical protein
MRKVLASNAVLIVPVQTVRIRGILIEHGLGVFLKLEVAAIESAASTRRRCD